MKISRYILTLMCIAFSNVAKAQPDFTAKYVIDEVVLYRDSRNISLFYYAPYGLELVKNKEDKPDFKFIQMRYTGTRLSEDQGKHGFRSLLRFKVAHRTASKAKIDHIKKVMRNKRIRFTQLRPLPIHNLKATLIHGAANEEQVKTYSNGFFEEGETPANTYWTERDFVLRLSNEDAQLFHTTFTGNQATISVGYTYSAKGMDERKSEISVSGSKALAEDLKSNVEQKKDTAHATLTEKIVISGALSITVNHKKWPDLIEQIDLNERIPPGYAALDVYCFDFNNNLREDLYAKRITIKAEGVNGKEVEDKAIFKTTSPDSYAKTVKFIYAVRLNKPYSYRITEIYKDGSMERSPWKTVENWHHILDITTQPENPAKQ